MSNKPKSASSRKSAPDPLAAHRPSRDLDNGEAIDAFVDAFYARMLRDPRLAPIFFDVAKIDLAIHLPRIKAYWRKMLLGDAAAYRGHMMARHRAVDARRRLVADDYERWLSLFEQTLDSGFAGPGTDRARELGRRIAGNMRRNLSVTRVGHGSVTPKSSVSN